MSRSLVFALLSVGLLSACAGKLGGASIQPGMDETHSNSVGFTGVGVEPSYDPAYTAS